jgi:hypothetical protein
MVSLPLRLVSTMVSCQLWNQKLDHLFVDRQSLSNTTKSPPMLRSIANGGGIRQNGLVLGFRYLSSHSNTIVHGQALQHMSAE